MADILIVEDNPDLAVLLAAILHSAGHETRDARNGREGLDRVAERAPAVVLLNIEMPVLNGAEMAYELFLRDCGDEDIPVILVSGIVGLPDIAARMGTPYSLAKPYTTEGVLEIVERALREQIPPRPRETAA
jgi:CheY-like chemotaxis protein